MNKLFRPKPSQMLLLAAVPSALASSALPTHGQVFLNEAQALQAIFGTDVQVKREPQSLTDAQRTQLEQSSRLHFPESSYSFFVVARHDQLAGYALVLDEIGKSEPITFMVGMDPAGKVIDVALMVFRESRGAEVKDKRFLRQFHGKRVGDALRIDQDILNYSGATLSSKALARGVKRALLLLNQFYPPEKRQLSAPRLAPLPASPLLPIASAGHEQALCLYRQARYRMGTVCEIRVWADCASKAAAFIAAGFNEIARLDRIFSNYREDSELTYVNRTAADHHVEVSPEFWRLLRHSVHWSRISQGTFEITVRPLLRAWGIADREASLPSADELSRALMLVGSDKLELGNSTLRFRRSGMELDFGGVAKGYAAQQAVDEICKEGAAAALVNIGRSSISAAGMPRISSGPAPSAEPIQGLAVGEWPIVIADSSGAPDWSMGLILHSGFSLSTSGTSEQSFQREGRLFAHIIDPRTGWPIGYPCSASTVSRSGIRAETLTKPILLLDSQTRTRLLERAKTNWNLVRRDNPAATPRWEPKPWPDLFALL